MKRVIVAILFLVTLAGKGYPQSRADSPTLRSNAIKVDIGVLPGKAFVLGYEKAIREGQSTQVRIGFWPGSNQFSYYHWGLHSGARYTLYWTTAEYRFYLTNKSRNLVGLYVGPYAKYVFDHGSTWQSTPSSFFYLPHSRHFVFLGGMVGSQTMIWNRVIVEGSVGAGYAPLVINRMDGEREAWGYSPRLRFDLRFNLGLGIAF